MIDVGAIEGRVLAHFMYNELEKIARAGSVRKFVPEAKDVARRAAAYVPSAAPPAPPPRRQSIFELGESGAEATRTLEGKKNPFMAMADDPTFNPVQKAQTGIRQFHENRDIRLNLRRQLRLLDDQAIEARNLLKSVDPKDQIRGRKMLQDIQVARRQARRGAPPPPAAAPKPKEPAKKTVGQQFDRVANLTGKGVLIGGAGLGAAALYDASQKQQNPYSNY